MVAALIAAMVAGARYEHEARKQDLLRLPPPLCGYSWVFVQREIAKFTRAYWHDRAGYGWSKPGADPRISAAIAKDLHELLRADEVPPPCVLVVPRSEVSTSASTTLSPDEVAGPRSIVPMPAFLIILKPSCTGYERDRPVALSSPQ